jgi:hypothetical protein
LWIIALFHCLPNMLTEKLKLITNCFFFWTQEEQEQSCKKLKGVKMCQWLPKSKGRGFLLGAWHDVCIHEVLGKIFSWNFDSVACSACSLSWLSFGWHLSLSDEMVWTPLPQHEMGKFSSDFQLWHC